jgi:hypothetical protein
MRDIYAEVQTARALAGENCKRPARQSESKIDDHEIQHSQT